MIVGSIVIIASNQVLDSTSPPNNARVIFYLVLVAAVLLTLKTWPKRIAALAGTVVFGLVLPRDRRRPLVGRDEGERHLGRLPELGDRALGADPLLTCTSWPSVAISSLLPASSCSSSLKGWWRIVVLVPTLVLTAFVWGESDDPQQPAVTRSVLFGVLLIATMTLRPRGAAGTAKVEIVLDVTRRASHGLARAGNGRFPPRAPLPFVLTADGTGPRPPGRSRRRKPPAPEASGPDDECPPRTETVSRRRSAGCR